MKKKTHTHTCAREITGQAKAVCGKVHDAFRRRPLTTIEVKLPRIMINVQRKQY
uniref:Uncharacterized protein n=1 Tax=Anopheles atroparvus TaxID=41427 RepID=A0AAG5D4I3_ANOAO